MALFYYVTIEQGELEENGNIVPVTLQIDHSLFIPLTVDDYSSDTLQTIRRSLGGSEQRVITRHDDFIDFTTIPVEQEKVDEIWHFIRAVRDGQTFFFDRWGQPGQVDPLDPIPMKLVSNSHREQRMGTTPYRTLSFRGRIV